MPLHTGSTSWMKMAFEKGLQRAYLRAQVRGEVGLAFAKNLPKHSAEAELIPRVLFQL